MTQNRKIKRGESSPESLLNYASDDERKTIDDLLRQIQTAPEQQSKDVVAGEIVHTAQELATRLGVSLQLVYRWCQDPTFPGQPARGGSGGRSSYDVAACLAWWESRGRRKGGGDESRARKQAAEAAIKELELARRAGRLIDREQAASIYSATVAAARSQLEDLPALIVSELPADRPKLHRLVSRIVRRRVLAVLDTLASAVAAEEEEAEESQAGNGAGAA